MEQKEIWKDVIDYEGIYMVSNWGRVKSCERTRKVRGGGIRVVRESILKPATNRDGYLMVSLSNKGVHKTYRVHRLVAEAFLENKDNLSEVNHKDEDKTNNHVSNLEWCTREYNMRYGTIIERIKKTLSTKVLPKAKSVIQVTLKGEVVGIYSSVKECAMKNHLPFIGVYRAVNGCYEVYRDHVFRYVTD